MSIRENVVSKNISSISIKNIKGKKDAMSMGII